MATLQSGDRVDWNPECPNIEALKRDFGEGPFTVRGVEDGAPEGGQWISLLNSEGLAWVNHRSRWESPEADKPGMYKAIPPTFHSDWLVTT